jgi:hypothetical protein
MVGSGTLCALGRTLREFHQGMAHTGPAWPIRNVDFQELRGGVGRAVVRSAEKSPEGGRIRPQFSRYNDNSSRIRWRTYLGPWL